MNSRQDLSACSDLELEIIEGIKRGLADAKAGRIVPHEQVMGEARQIISNAKERETTRK